MEKFAQHRLLSIVERQMAIISKITSARPCAGYTSKVITAYQNGKYYQYGKTIEPGHLSYRELYVKGHNYFKHIKETLNEFGKVIKGSRFREEVVGPEANNKMIHKFGVDA